MSSNIASWEMSTNVDNYYFYYIPSCYNKCEYIDWFNEIRKVKDIVFDHIEFKSVHDIREVEQFAGDIDENTFIEKAKTSMGIVIYGEYNKCYLAIGYDKFWNRVYLITKEGEELNIEEVEKLLKLDT